jgi:manganese/zinc/iron transport system permease protein
LPVMIVISATVAVLSAIIGHWAAITIPNWFGYASSSTAGMMALTTGVLFALAVIFSPKNGLLIMFSRRFQLELGILGDDVLAYLYRLEEKGTAEAITDRQIREELLGSRFAISMVMWWYKLTNQLQGDHTGYRLTDAGRTSAASLVRSHRLWEQYLVDQAGVASDRIHGQAERLEHFTDRKFRDELDRQTSFPSSDPHGSPIPAEQSTDQSIESQKPI